MFKGLIRKYIGEWTTNVCIRNPKEWNINVSLPFDCVEVDRPRAQDALARIRAILYNAYCEIETVMNEYFELKNKGKS